MAPMARHHQLDKLHELREKLRDTTLNLSALKRLHSRAEDSAEQAGVDTDVILDKRSKESLRKATDELLSRIENCINANNDSNESNGIDHTWPEDDASDQATDRNGTSESLQQTQSAPSINSPRHHPSDSVLSGSGSPEPKDQDEQRFQSQSKAFTTVAILVLLLAIGYGLVFHQAHMFNFRNASTSSRPPLPNVDVLIQQRLERYSKSFPQDTVNKARLRSILKAGSQNDALVVALVGTSVAKQTAIIDAIKVVHQSDTLEVQSASSAEDNIRQHLSESRGRPLVVMRGMQHIQNLMGMFHACWTDPGGKFGEVPCSSSTFVLILNDIQQVSSTKAFHKALETCKGDALGCSDILTDTILPDLLHLAEATEHIDPRAEVRRVDFALLTMD
eukprot:TRINITY_DN6500_c0_g1_i2.p1 TRINITY_DN6500_c0_g1~~TRINITY_DN6500_c0_g1_i2.p1  ORF type:complete len:391 (+),score=63.78 TRINITY_DN6500_c0_g1_i2:64-1236(+)